MPLFSGFLVPKLRLGTRDRETPFRRARRGRGAVAGDAAAKQSFAVRRSQTEFGNEEKFRAFLGLDALARVALVVDDVWFDEIIVIGTAGRASDSGASLE
jgi:hypothetical protein